MLFFSFISIAQAAESDANSIFNRSIRALDVIGERAFSTPQDTSYSGWNNPFRIFWFAIQGFLVFLGILVLVGYMYAGWLWMTSQGNSEKTGKATKIFLQTSLGLLVVLAAYSISFLALSIVTRATGAPEFRDTEYEISL